VRDTRPPRLGDDFALGIMSTAPPSLSAGRSIDFLAFLVFCKEHHGVIPRSSRTERTTVLYRRITNQISYIIPRCICINPSRSTYMKEIMKEDCLKVHKLIVGTRASLLSCFYIFIHQRNDVYRWFIIRLFTARFNIHFNFSFKTSFLLLSRFIVLKKKLLPASYERHVDGGKLI